MKTIVSLNSGSSSIKFAPFMLDGANNPTLSAGGKIERIGIVPSLRVRSADGDIVLERDWPDGASPSHAELLKDIFACAAQCLGDRQVIAIGHRVVHGGAKFATPRLVDNDVLDALEKLNPLASLHQPRNLAGIRANRTAPTGAAAGGLLRHRVPPRQAGGRRAPTAPARFP